jgi:hypothetical protein
LGVLNGEYDVRVLRAAAVTARMHAGDRVLVRRLIEEAVSPRAQMDLADMIDRSIGSFGGGDITGILVDRIDRRGKGSVGVAHYLAQHVRVADLPQLERLRQICVDATALQILEGAVLSSRNR